MQNKANFKIGKITLNPCCEKHYGKKYPLRPPAKQSQTNPTCRGEASSEPGFIAAMPDQTQKQLNGAKDRTLQDLTLAYFGACNFGLVGLGSCCVD